LHCLTAPRGALVTALSFVSIVPGAEAVVGGWFRVHACNSIPVPFGSIVMVPEIGVPAASTSVCL